MTKKELLIKALEARGFRQVASRSKKFVTLALPNADHCEAYFIGKCGALRTGRTLSDSRDTSDRLKEVLLREARGEATTR